MALVACTKCNKQYDAAEKSCPHCKNAVAQAKPTQVKAALAKSVQAKTSAANIQKTGPRQVAQKSAAPRAQQPGPSKIAYIVGIAGAALAAILYHALSAPAPNTAPAFKLSPICSQDWHYCADTQHLISGYTGMPRIRSECKAAALNNSTYGDLSLPLEAFTLFNAKDNAVDSGILVLREDHATAQSGGGGAQVSVTCTYSLKDSTVAGLAIAPR